ncbi:multidrug effflux MFS transporter [Demequina sp. SYSU T00192]|uniref:Multidrug effflux MFS transporter n=1 Tax=Demequina litoralis TaxID=3051660 RepID=A0ABT8GB10_9MICO|nr:multidrug effflux MFS transporter [Demequina sp. SYSU T00192]MDN4476327.1 multidrug effflux MFS transporter [Demequina sp. SYSU T00192]
MSGTASGSGAAPPMARVLPVLAALTALAPLSVDIYTPSLPAVQEELGGSDALTQGGVTLFLLGIGLGQLVWGPLSDRFGRRPVILLGVAGWTLASGLDALATGPEMLVAVRALAGLCGAAGIVVARSVVRDLSTDTHAMASRIGVLAMVTSIAPVVAPILGAAIAGAWGWRADFVVLAALGGVMLLVFALAVPETLPPSRRSQGGLGAITGGLARAGANREVAGAALALGAHAFGFYAYIATASFVVERELGRSPAAFALVFGTNAVAVLAANMVFRRLVRRRHPAGPLGLGLAISAVSGAALWVAASLGAPELLWWLASMGFAAGTGLVLPGAHSWAQATPVASGAASALTGSAQFLGGVLGSPVTGLMGPTAAHLGIVIALASTAAVAIWAAARPRIVPTPSPASPASHRPADPGPTPSAPPRKVDSHDHDR